MPNDEQFTSHNIERPCGHMQTICTTPQKSLADYNFRIVPELRESIQKPCEQCEQQKADLAKQKLVQEMQDKAGKK